MEDGQGDSLPQVGAYFLKPSTSVNNAAGISPKKKRKLIGETLSASGNGVTSVSPMKSPQKKARNVDAANSAYVQPTSDDPHTSPESKKRKEGKKKGKKKGKKRLYVSPSLYTHSSQDLFDIPDFPVEETENTDTAEGFDLSTVVDSLSHKTSVSSEKKKRKDLARESFDSELVRKVNHCSETVSAEDRKDSACETLECGPVKHPETAESASEFIMSPEKERKKKKKKMKELARESFVSELVKKVDHSETVSGEDSACKTLECGSVKLTETAESASEFIVSPEKKKKKKKKKRKDLTRESFDSEFVRKVNNSETMSGEDRKDGACKTLECGPVKHPETAESTSEVIVSPEKKEKKKKKKSKDIGKETFQSEPSRNADHSESVGPLREDDVASPKKNQKIKKDTALDTLVSGSSREADRSESVCDLSLESSLLPKRKESKDNAKERLALEPSSDGERSETCDPSPEQVIESSEKKRKKNRKNMARETLESRLSVEADGSETVSDLSFEGSVCPKKKKRRNNANETLESEITREAADASLERARVSPVKRKKKKEIARETLESGDQIREQTLTSSEGCSVDTEMASPGSLQSDVAGRLSSLLKSSQENSSPERENSTHAEEGEARRVSLNPPKAVPLSGKECAKSCYLCHEAMSSKNRYTQHLANVHDKIVFQCSKCLKRMSSQETLEHHSEITCPLKNSSESKGMKFTCTFCPLSYSVHKNCWRHMSQEHGEGKKHKCRSCEHCGKTFTPLTRKNRIIEHQVKCREGHRVKARDKTHLCDTCNKMFASQQSLSNHIRTIHKKDIFECVKCGKEFRSSTNYFTHMKACMVNA